VGVVDTGAVSKVCESGTALGSTKEHSIASLGSPQGKLIKCEALSSSRNNSLAGGLSEAKGANSHLGAFQHTHIISDLTNNDSDLVFLIGHVLGQSVKSDWWRINLGHVKTFEHSLAEGRIRTTGKELVQFDQKSVVGVGRLNDLGRALVASAASSCFQINSHVVSLQLQVSICKD